MDRSGPDDIGTQPEDAPRTLGTDLGGRGSPTSRLWREAQRTREESAESEKGPEIELPTPPDNPGGPPPGRPEAS
jgi:hypothetical protein